VQEFENAMLKMWGISRHSKGRRKYVRMVNEWFEAIDTDSTNAIDFQEFKHWYTTSISEAHALGVR
jgi:Ca2+-binding EF-hand superfamily protein